MEENILCKIKELEIYVIRLLFNDAEGKRINPPTVTQTRIINYLYEHQDEEVYQKDIERGLNLRRATISEVLKTMEKRGLIEKTINPTDARSRKIVIIKSKEAKNEEIKSNIRRVENTLRKNISQEELVSFSLTLEKMQQNLKEQYNKQGGKNA